MIKKHFQDGRKAIVDVAAPAFANQVVVANAGGVPLLYFFGINVFMSDEDKKKGSPDSELQIEIDEMEAIARVALSPKAVDSLLTALQNYKRSSEE